MKTVGSLYELVKIVELGGLFGIFLSNLSVPLWLLSVFMCLASQRMLGLHRNSEAWLELYETKCG